MSPATVTATAVLLPSKSTPLPPHHHIHLLRRPIFSASSLTLSHRPSTTPLRASSSDSASTADLEMVRGRDGVYSARDPTVVVLWDLDNKPPRGPPYPAAVSLLRAASILGRVVEISAYANRHAFQHLPQWVRSHRSDRRRLDILERKNLVTPPSPYICSVCGRKCRTNPDLKRHFLQLHAREREKKVARLKSLKGKKRQRYKERFLSGNQKYDEAARELVMPKSGYGLAAELRRAGVFVKTVADKPQAADAALKRQMRHSITCGIDWMFLVSDDSDFTDMVRRARESDMRTVVVGDGRRALGQLADLWVPWARVENGEVDEDMLLRGRMGEALDDDEDEVFFASYEDAFRVSAFSEEEVVMVSEDDEYWDSEEEEDDDFI